MLERLRRKSNSRKDNSRADSLAAGPGQSLEQGKAIFPRKVPIRSETPDSWRSKTYTEMPLTPPLSQSLPGTPFSGAQARSKRPNMTTRSQSCSTSLASQLSGQSHQSRRPSASALRRTASPSGISRRSEASSSSPGQEFCGYCEMATALTLEAEDVAELECGHLVHMQCYFELGILDPEGPRCGICDKPGQLKDSNRLRAITNNSIAHSLDYDPNKVFGGVMLPEPAMIDLPLLLPLKTTKTGLSSETPSPAYFTQNLQHLGDTSVQSTAVDRLSQPLGNQRLVPATSLSLESLGTPLTDPLPRLSPSPGSSSSFCISFSKRGSQCSGSTVNSTAVSQLEEALSSVLESASLGTELSLPGSLPLNLSAVAERDSLSEGVKSFRILVNVCVPRSPTRRPSSTSAEDVMPVLSLSDHLQTAADFEYGMELAKRISELTFRGTPLAELNPGALRLQSSLEFRGSDNKSWRSCECFLFQKFFILIREGTVKAIFDIVKHFDSINFEGVLRIKLTGLALDALELNGNKAELKQLECALRNEHAEFPLVPVASRQGSTADFTGSMDIPIKTILCFPATKELNLKSSTLLECVANIRASMGPFDKLGLLVFSRSHILAIFTLQRASWEGWEDRLNRTMADISKVQDSTDEDTPLKLLLQEACNLLNEDVSSAPSASSILLVSDNGILNPAELPREILTQKIPVHSVEWGEMRDPLALSALAQISGGSFRHVRSCAADELSHVLRRMVRYERSATHQNVSLILKPRIGMSISEVEGCDPMCSELPISPSTVIEQGTVRWDIGCMHYGESRSLTVRLQVGDQGNLGGAGIRNIMMASVVASPAAGGAEHRANTRIAALFATEEGPPSPQVVASDACLRAAAIMERACAYIQAGQNRAAFRTLDGHHNSLENAGQALDESESHQSLEKSSLRALYIALMRLYREQCDAILQPPSCPSDLLSPLAESAWAIRQKWR